MNLSDKVNTHLLPDLIKKPVMLLWALIVPQVILLLINSRSFWLINEEILKDKLYLWHCIFGFEIGLLMLVLLVGWLHRTRQEQVHWGWNILFLFSHIGYLWYVSSNLWQMIPSNIEPWILDGGSLILNQFTFMMPGLFYAGLRLACFETRLQTRSDFGLSLLAAVLAPLFYYIIFIGIGGYTRSFGWMLPAIIATLFFIGVTVMTFIGLIRALVISYNGIRTKSDIAQLIFSIVICLAGPIGGLLLNRTIPFPADFQSPWVYVLAVVNGLIVMIPSVRKADGHGYLLFARALTYPFTFYFFLVFLPFLPLSLPAIFAIGSGFLILVPVVLCLLHTKRLFDDFKTCHQANGIRIAVILTLIGLLVLPGYFTLEAFRDKASLTKSLQYVYSPDYSRDFTFKGSVKSVKRTLINLKQFKEGIQLPYLSDFYNSIVFEDMVLPDKKIEYMYRLFTGEDLQKINFRQSWGGFGLGRLRGGRGNVWRAGTGRAPIIDSQVDLVSTNVNSYDEGDITKTRVRLEMHNVGKSDRAEFFREIRIPEGVLISGFSLKVGEEMVPGQIFEKRAAMWVYHMIRDFTRRDPGILTYKSPTQIDLNVYPFTVNETRVAEIEFQFPRNYTPNILIGAQSLALNQNANQAMPQLISGAISKNTSFFILPKEILAGLPKVKREPYLHFILDFSKGAPVDPNVYIERVNSVINQYLDAKNVKITAANFNIDELTPNLISLEDKDAIVQALKKGSLARQGALDVGRVIKQELVQYSRNLKEEHWQQYPLFVVITQNAMNVLSFDDIEFFSIYLPDCNYYLVSTQSNQIEKRVLWMSSQGMKDEEVIALKADDVVSILPANSENMQAAYFYGNNSNSDVTVYDSSAQSFVPMKEVQDISETSSYAQGVDLIFKNLQIMTNPAEFDKSLSNLVQASRDSGIMIPSTSYIIVERSSQWKTLQLKEKQRLKTSEGLEFKEDFFNTPAPPLWSMIFLLLVFYWLKNRRGLVMEQR